MSSSAVFLSNAGQFALIIGGLMLLWRLGLSAEARRAPPRLTAWDVSITDFFLCIWCVIIGGLLAPFAAGYWIRQGNWTEDSRLILATAVFQLGMLAGLLAARFFRRQREVEAPTPAGPSRVHPILAGAATFLVSMPVILVVSLLWQGLLDLAGIPAPQQEAVEILRHAKSVFPVVGLLVSAVLIAPITEELVFRAVIFRYVRTRLPRWAALLLPACIFGALHNNLASFAPLVALGVVFSLAYERTGRISTTVVAHALFNLTATLLVMLGVDV